ncbi:MAG TPA: pseudouridine synthase [Terriglobales bacterium]|nr:pseudouridine synthase [Terriglobales bacterium]
MSIAPTPARIRLPRLAVPPPTVLDFLCAQFPHIGRDVWLTRSSAGTIRLDDGSAITPSTPYQPGRMISYFREVISELQIPFAESVVYEDERILVADKPHFVPVTPGGDVVNECLLFRLQKRTGLCDLAPVHRLDRDTAGLVVFVKHKPDRAPYARLFENGEVEREYVAVANAENGASPAAQEWMVENRLEPEPGSFRMRIGEGAVNARTRIVYETSKAGRRLFRLFPATGKKHQLRIHMWSLGFPIVNDPFYPELKRLDPADFSCPMQLLACRLTFRDPRTNESHTFRTQRSLRF